MYVLCPGKVTLRLNSDVVKRAKNAGMNLSYFLEVKLLEYLVIFKGMPKMGFELIFTSKKFTVSNLDYQKNHHI
jgi:hypothetical protein